MAHAYTPGLRVTGYTTVRKTRRLPLTGDVLVKAGDHVAPDTVVARTHLPGNVHNVNVANLLGIASGDIASCMLKKTGDPVEKNEIIARSKGLFGLFKSAARAPVSGEIELISEVTGQVLLREPPIPVQIDAYVDGQVVEVLPGEGVVVETRGAFIQGIFGIGGEACAPLAMITDDPGAEVTEADVSDRFTGRIVCGGALITLGALHALRDAGAAGVVAGGVRYHDVGVLLGYQLGVAITGGEDVGLTLIATEGFGRMRMAERTFRLLQSLQGQTASISGATQIRAGVIRPEIVIPRKPPSGEAESRDDVARGLVEGSLVRIIREPYFGRIGTVVALPARPQPLPTEAVVRVLDVALESGERVTVPRANVELVEG